MSYRHNELAGIADFQAHPKSGQNGRVASTRNNSPCINGRWANLCFFRVARPQQVRDCKETHSRKQYRNHVLATAVEA